MRNRHPTWSGLLLMLVASAALARGPSDTVLIRTLKVSDHPGYSTHAIYVAGQVVTVLCFEKDVEPAGTRLLGWEGKFRPPVVGSNKVVLEPIRDLDPEESLSLLVTLVDGTELAFLVKPKNREEWGDRPSGQRVQGQMRKLPESKPGMAILESSIAAAFVVDSFR